MLIFKSDLFSSCIILGNVKQMVLVKRVDGTASMSNYNEVLSCYGVRKGRLNGLNRTHIFKSLPLNNHGHYFSDARNLTKALWSHVLGYFGFQLST